MDGVIEQKSVLVHSKISDAGKRNGLINTRNFMAESRDGLVSVYPAPQYQSHRLVASATPGSLEGGRSESVQQLLDPNTLQQSVESHYRPNIILYSDGVLRSWGDGVATDCCETTFIEDRSPTKDSLEYPDGKFIDLSADDIKIHTLSYDVEEEEELQELEDRFTCIPTDRGSSSVFPRSTSSMCCWPLLRLGTLTRMLRIFFEFLETGFDFFLPCFRELLGRLAEMLCEILDIVSHHASDVADVDRGCLHVNQ
ncbi:hypothetical protein STEG23_021597 [Scotinomys teguina]